MKKLLLTNALLVFQFLTIPTRTIVFVFYEIVALCTAIFRGLDSYEKHYKHTIWRSEQKMEALRQLIKRIES